MTRNGGGETSKSKRRNTETPKQVRFADKQKRSPFDFFTFRRFRVSAFGGVLLLVEI
jgi:hypothetical protein